MRNARSPGLRRYVVVFLIGGILWLMLGFIILSLRPASIRSPSS